MTQETINNREILMKLAKLQSEVEVLKQRETMLEKKSKLTVIEESLAELWDNEDDEIWNEY